MSTTSIETFQLNHNGSLHVSSLGVYKFSQHRAPYRAFLSHFSKKLDFDWKVFPRTPKQANGDFDVLFSEDVGLKVYQYVTERGRTLKSPSTPKQARPISLTPKKTREPKWISDSSSETLVKSLKEVRAFLTRIMLENGHKAEDLEDYLVESQLGWWNNSTIYNESANEDDTNPLYTVAKKLGASLRAILEGYVTHHKEGGLAFTKKGLDYFCKWVEDENSVYETEYLKLSNHNIYGN